MDLSTTYLGLKLRSPLVPSASPLSQSIDNIRRMEDEGAGAVVLYSLFEEELFLERYKFLHYLEDDDYSLVDASTYYPEFESYTTDPDAYYEHIRQAKEAVDIPIIASLNGPSLGDWSESAKKMQSAGADAIELNLYYVEADMSIASSRIERDYAETVRLIKAAVSIPIAVKLSPFFTGMANMARNFVEAGADALVLFNRFYQPDVNLETLEIKPHLLLSTPQELRLPLRWIAILHGRIKADLAATSGVHRAGDALKLLLAGANVTMLCSVLLRHGIGQIKVIEHHMRAWMQRHKIDSIKSLQGRLSQINYKNPDSYERAQYLRALKGYRPKPSDEAAVSS